MARVLCDPFNPLGFVTLFDTSLWKKYLNIIPANGMHLQDRPVDCTYVCVYIYIDIYVFFVKNTRTSYLPHLSFLFTAPSLQLSPWLSPLCATSPAVSSVLLAPLQASTMHGCKQFGLTFGLVKKLRVSHLVFLGWKTIF